MLRLQLSFCSRIIVALVSFDYDVYLLLGQQYPLALGIKVAFLTNDDLPQQRYTDDEK